MHVIEISGLNDMYFLVVDKEPSSKVLISASEEADKIISCDDAVWMEKFTSELARNGIKVVPTGKSFVEAWSS